jgi:hypothetical protein
MFDCSICGTRHSENPEACRAGAEEAIKGRLSEAFELIFEQLGDTPAIRLMIANFMLGYTGATYGLHIPS